MNNLYLSRSHKFRSVSLRFAAVLLAMLTALPFTAGVFAESPSDNVSPKLTGSVPAWAIKSSERFTFDFSQEDLTYYSQHEALQITARTGMSVTGGKLVCLENKSMSLATRGALGDDFGIAGGSVGFKLSVTGGNAVVLLRDQDDKLIRSDNAMRFRFDVDTLTVKDDFNNKSVRIDISRFTSGGREMNVEITDRPTYFTVTIDDELIARITYTERAAVENKYSVSNYGADLVFCDGSGNELARSENSSMQRAGSMVFALEKLQGYVDDFWFDRTEID